MLRQVAYDTLSRRDRKARHLAVAAHLRTAFPGDGEEVIDVIARHYLDALNAIPDDADAAEIRGQAVTALTRAAERAVRTGAPAQAAASYAAAAELSPPGIADGAAAGLWERAAQAALADASYPVAVTYAEHARGQYLRHGQDRDAARVQALAGRALSTWGRHADAREQLTAAVEVLREGPDTDTVSAMNRLASLEVFAGSPDAERLSAESLTLGQALNVGLGLLAELLVTRGLFHLLAERRPQAISYFRESARLAAQAGDNFRVGRALLNLADTLMPSDPAAAADAARTAAGHLRRTGERAVRELLDLLDSYQPGHLAPMLRAERDLARARLAADDGDAGSFAAAIQSLRVQSTPYHLAHGLLDYAEYLLASGDAEAAAAAIDEARDLAGRLRCRPLLDRATQDSPRVTS